DDSITSSLSELAASSSSSSPSGSSQDIFSSATETGAATSIASSSHTLVPVTDIVGSSLFCSSAIARMSTLKSFFFVSSFRSKSDLLSFSWSRFCFNDSSSWTVFLRSGCWFIVFASISYSIRFLRIFLASTRFCLLCTICAFAVSMPDSIVSEMVA
uniref:Uncharacterized protein n=1 Tax=Anopheles maculatus TaxID=74869 RepID=A0A182SHQ0_9DIPT